MVRNSASRGQHRRSRLSTIDDCNALARVSRGPFTCHASPSPGGTGGTRGACGAVSNGRAESGMRIVARKMFEWAERDGLMRVRDGREGGGNVRWTSEL